MATRIALPNGATFQIAATFGTEKVISAISNANPAIATAAANGLADGDFILINSGWGKLDGRASRVADAETGTFALENINTLNENFYAPGGGAGSFLEVLTWVEVTKITTVSATGGEQQFLTVGYLAEDDDRQFPTNRNPMSMAFTVEDQPTAPYVPIVEGYSDNKIQTVGRLNLPNGDKIIYPGFASITETPTLERNQLMTRVITFSLSGRSTRYLAA